MDRIETEKTYPQRVEVLNELKARVESSSDSPLVSKFTSALTQNYGGANESLKVYVNNLQNFPEVKPFSASSYNVTFGSCVASNSGANVVVPLNMNFFNISGTKLADLILEIESALPTLFPSGSVIRFTHSVLDSTGTAHFYVTTI